MPWLEEEVEERRWMGMESFSSVWATVVYAPREEDAGGAMVFFTGPFSFVLIQVLL